MEELDITIGNTEVSLRKGNHVSLDKFGNLSLLKEGPPDAPRAITILRNIGLYFRIINFTYNQLNPIVVT